ncbi:hypothetical protein ACRAWF_19110 [Streptomyces sp. L7]
MPKFVLCQTYLTDDHRRRRALVEPAETLDVAGARWFPDPVRQRPGEAGKHGQHADSRTHRRGGRRHRHGRRWTAAHPQQRPYGGQADLRRTDQEQHGSCVLPQVRALGGARA